MKSVNENHTQHFDRLAAEAYDRDSKKKDSEAARSNENKSDYRNIVSPLNRVCYIGNISDARLSHNV